MKFLTSRPRLLALFVAVAAVASWGGGVMHPKIVEGGGGGGGTAT